jgi:hypothetical protein
MPKHIITVVPICCATRHLFEKPSIHQDSGEANRVEYPKYEI